MEVFRFGEGSEGSIGPSAVTIGTFDGVHRGHQTILRRLLQQSAESALKSVVVTFDPHPQIVLNKAGRQKVELLSTIDERLELFEAYHVPYVLIMPFTTQFSATPPEQFIEDILVKYLNAQALVIGYDHVFGHDRAGDVGLLRSYGEKFGFSVEQVEALELNNTTVSSTKIRRALRDKELDLANSMLGYPYFLEGVVVQGDGRGRKLGIPTANVKPMDENKLIPGNGVYLVSSQINGRLYYGMANIGTRPTFTNDIEPVLEVHYFDLNQMIYDQVIHVWFLKFIRPEQKFESVDFFFSQLAEDRFQCFEYIEQMRGTSISG